MLRRPAGEVELLGLGERRRIPVGGRQGRELVGVLEQQRGAQVIMLALVSWPATSRMCLRGAASARLRSPSLRRAARSDRTSSAGSSIVASMSPEM
jgi:hypothetical protein